MVNGTGIFGYDFTYLLNVDYCLAERLKCSSTGTLSVFAEVGCLGKSNNYTLTTKPQFINDKMGGVYAEYSEIACGNQNVEWIHYEPAIFNVPNQKSWLEIFATILFVLSLIVAVWVLVFIVIRLVKRRTVQTALMIVSQFLIICYLVARVLYFYTIHFSIDHFGWN